MADGHCQGVRGVFVGDLQAQEVLDHHLHLGLGGLAGAPNFYQNFPGFFSMSSPSKKPIMGPLSTIQGTVRCAL